MKCEENIGGSNDPLPVVETPRLPGSLRDQLSLESNAVWTDCMLEALAKGVKGGKWYSLMDKVWEWCADWYGEYPTGSVTDPTGPRSGSSRVHRGGGWFNGARNVRSAIRFRDFPGSRFDNLGFRSVLSSVR